MIIKNLELKNFRNYKELKLQPSPGINLILGENAQGKSNLLEAVYILSTSKSFRALKEEELVSWGSSYALVSEEVSRKDRETTIEIRWIREGDNNLKKEIMINNGPVRKIQDLLGEVTCVVFTPQNLEIVQGAPSVRRKSYKRPLPKTSRPLRIRSTQKFWKDPLDQTTALDSI